MTTTRTAALLVRIALAHLRLALRYRGTPDSAVDIRAALDALKLAQAALTPEPRPQEEIGT